MKKALVIFFALLLVLSVSAVLPAAKNGTNVQREISYIEDAPVIDGVVERGEYGREPMDSWELGDRFDEKNPVFDIRDGYEITDDDLAVDFYAAWDEENLYLAWEVHTKYDSRLPFDVEDGFMFEYCCMQLMLTTGAPDNSKNKYQTSDWAGDYFELGMCMRDDGNYYKVCWSVPAAVGSAFDKNHWEYAGSRDEDEQITVYECRLPWEKLGLEKTLGNGSQFGLNFGVCAQENYMEAIGMVEYVDGIFHGKDADNAVCFTLVDGPEGCGGLPFDPTQSMGNPGVSGTQIPLDGLNRPVTDGTRSLITYGNINQYNPRWATALLLRPLSDVYDVDGHYQVVDIVQGQGTDVFFNTSVMPGDVVLLAHSSGTGYPGHNERRALASLDPGESQVYIFGYHTEDGSAAQRYSNPMVIILPLYEYIDYVPDDPYEEPDWSYEESYEEPEWSYAVSCEEPDWSYDWSYEEPDWSYDWSYEEPEWSCEESCEEPEWSYAVSCEESDWSYGESEVFESATESRHESHAHVSDFGDDGDDAFMGDLDDEDDEDDDDDDDDRGSRKKSSRSDNTLLIVIIVVGAVLFVGVDVAVVLLLLRRK